MNFIKSKTRQNLKDEIFLKTGYIALDQDDADGATSSGGEYILQVLNYRLINNAPIDIDEQVNLVLEEVERINNEINSENSEETLNDIVSAECKEMISPYIWDAYRMFAMYPSELEPFIMNEIERTEDNEINTLDGIIGSAWWGWLMEKVLEQLDTKKERSKVYE